MHFKLIIAFAEDSMTDSILEAAREAGATGATVINHARGEGLTKARGVFGLEVTSQRDVILLLVEQSRARAILEQVAAAGEFDDTPGTGIALQIDVEDAIGVQHQMTKLAEALED
jgi:nitrogen regulatory protein PII